MLHFVQHDRVRDTSQFFDCFVHENAAFGGKREASIEFLHENRPFRGEAMCIFFIEYNLLLMMSVN